MLCSSGFVLPATSTPVQQTCQACVSPCATCYGQTNQCTSCVSGFKLQGWACITTYTLVAAVTIDRTLTAFLTNSDGYISYLQQLKSFSGLTKVTTSSCVSGSVSTNSALDVPDSSDNSATLAAYNGLNSGLAGGSIGGGTILSYSITASGGDIPTEGVNLALILGITIPLGLIRTFLCYLSDYRHWCAHLLQV